jgi:hypothetical protein
MANGNTALKLLASESTPAIAMADQPSATPTPRGIEAELGVATAAAAVAVGQALVDFQAIGAMAPATRKVGGEALARVCMIRLDHFGEIDFTAAGAEAKRLLRQRHGAAWRAEYGTELPEGELDTLVGWVFEVTDRVVADEQALQRAWAN